MCVLGVMKIIQAVIEAILWNNGAIVWEISCSPVIVVQLSRLQTGSCDDGEVPNITSVFVVVVV